MTKKYDPSRPNESLTKKKKKRPEGPLTNSDTRVNNNKSTAGQKYARHKLQRSKRWTSSRGLDAADVDKNEM